MLDKQLKVFVVRSTYIVSLNQPRRCRRVLGDKDRSIPGLVTAVISPVMHERPTKGTELILKHDKFEIAVIGILRIVTLYHASTRCGVRGNRYAALPRIGYVAIVVPIVDEIRT